MIVVASCFLWDAEQNISCFVESEMAGCFALEWHESVAFFVCLLAPSILRHALCARDTIVSCTRTAEFYQDIVARGFAQ